MIQLNKTYQARIGADDLLMFNQSASFSFKSHFLIIPIGHPEPHEPDYFICLIAPENTPEQHKLANKYGLPGTLGHSHIEDWGLLPQHLGKKFLLCWSDFMFEDENLMIVSYGLSCASCKEFHEYVSEPNCGSLFLCYSCRSNPIIRAVFDVG